MMWCADTSCPSSLTASAPLYHARGCGSFELCCCLQRWAGTGSGWGTSSGSPSVKDVRRYYKVRPDAPLVSCLLQQLLPAGPRGLGGAEQGVYLVIHPWEILSTEPTEKMKQSIPTVVLMWIAYSQRKAEFEARPAATSAPSLL